jgi:diguanylate cyclase (GGDEF)-like protein/PAS domain S-box-containing protein
MASNLLLRQPGAARLCILLVEDDADDAELMHAYLDEVVSDGAEILHARSLGDALRALQSQEVHLTLLDLDLPDSTGFQTLERMRALAAGPIVVVSGNGHPSLVEEVLKRRAYDVIPKQELDAATLRRILRLARLQHETGRALRATEGRFRALLENSAEAVALLDAAGRIEYASASMRRVLGYESREVTGRVSLEFVHPEDRGAVRAAFQRLQAALGTSETLRVRFTHKDGSLRLLESTAVNRIADPDVAGIVCNFRDLTSEADLEARFRATFEHAAVGLAQLDADGRIVLANERLCAILGYTRAELVGLSFRDVSHPEDREASAVPRARMYAGEIRQFTLRKRYLRKDGATVWVQITAALVRKAGGGPQHEITAFEDISEAVRIEAELKQSEGRFRALIEHSADGIVLLDETGRIRYASPATTRILGYAEGELLGRDGVELAHPEDAGGFRRDVEDIRRQPGGSLHAQARIRHKNGGYRLLEGTWTNLLGEPGVSALVANFRDVTERERSLQELRAAQARSARLSRMYAALSATNEEILKIPEPGMLYRRLCELLIEHGGLRLAAVRLVDRESGWIEPVAHAGGPASYLERARVSIDPNRPESHGPSGRVVLEGYTLVNNDYFADPALALWHGEARAAGIAALMSVPLRRGGEVIGLISLYSGETGWFDPEMVELAERMAANVSFALDNFDREAKRSGVAQALRESEERFRSLTELSADWYWEQDAQFRFTVISGPGADALANGSTASYLGKTRWETEDLEPYEGDWHAHRAQLERRESFHEVVFRRRLADGTSGYMSVSGEPVFDAEGGFAGYRGVAKNVTDKVRAALALRESETRFRSLTGLSSDWYWEQDADLRFVATGGADKLRGGITAAEHVGRRRWELPGTAALSGSWKEHQAVLAARLPFRDFMLRRTAAGGEVHYISVSGEPIFGEGGVFRGYRGVAKDVTASHRAVLALRESEERFRNLSGLSSDWYWEQDAEFRFTHTSVDRGSPVFGDPAALLGKARWDLPLTPLSCTWDRHREVLRAHRTFRDFEYSYTDEDGAPRYVSASGYPVFDDAGKFTGYRGIARDITARKHDEQRITVHAERQEAIARFGQYALGRRTTDELYAEAARTLRGGCVDAACGLELLADGARYMVRAADGAGAQRTLGMVATIAPDSLLPATLRENAPRVIGEEFLASRPLAGPGREWVRAMKSAVYIPVRSEDNPAAVLGMYSRQAKAFGSEDVRFAEAVAHVLSTALQRQRAEQRLAHLAQFDALTGLPNRTLLQDRFTQTLVQSRRRHVHAGVLFVDLDRFKLINDTLGHHQGDALIRQVGERLVACVRPGDTVGRISGDEFAVVLADLARPDDASIVAQKALDTLARPFDLGGNEAYVTASIGIAAFPADGDDAETLLKNADMAMYRAKESARNSYCFFTAEMNQRSVAKVHLNTDLRRALERSEFTLHYQPKVDLASGKLRGMEALLRWKHPARGLVSPGEFIPALEDSGLILPVGEWVIDEACRQLRCWSEAGSMPVPVAVNFSPKQFRRRDLDALIRAALVRSGVSAEFLELEITESCLMENPEDAVRALRNLRAAGLRISVDDFGTGYSSLSYLTRLPLSALKIDRSFVRDAETSAEAASIVRAVIDMAQNLRLTVIAEGVETEQQAAFLRRHGCDQAQGYFYGRPVPAEEISSRLARP